MIDDVGRDGGVLRVGAVLVEVHARDDHAGVTPFERVLQFALIGQREVGHRIGLAAPLGAERQPQPETLVRQRVAHAGRPVGVDAPQVEQFVFGRGEPGAAGLGVHDDLVRAIDVGAVGIDVERPFGSPFVAAAVEASQLGAGVGADVDIAADGDVGVEVPHRHAVGQLDQLVPVFGPVGTDRPFELLGLDGLEARRDLDAAVAHAAGVDDDRRGADGLVDRHGDDLVGGLAVVVGHVEIEAALEELAFEAHLPALDVLGFEVVVLDLAAQVVRAGETAVGVDRHQFVGRGVVTHVGPRAADFQQIDPRSVFFEIEHLVEQHAGRDRGVEIGVVARGERR